MANLGAVVAASMGEIQNKRLQNLYQKDFLAWQSDILGIRTYGLMQTIAETSLFGDIPRTVIKSSNGTSKSYTTAAMILWTGSVFDVGETVSIVSAPSLNQIDKVLMRYLKSFKGRAEERGNPIRGWINESLEWQTTGPNGHIPLAYGRKPAPGKEVETLQGVRSEFGRTYVFFDEAGGMPQGMWTAAEAVLTGASARLIAVGNPDSPNSSFVEIFRNKKYDDEYNRFTISSFDLPTFTGEVVYPDDPEMEQRMLSSLTQVSWVEHKKRIWGEKDARYLSKVLGEFPEDGGVGFFSQLALDRADDCDIPEDGNLRPVLGADIARFGSDESVIAENRGGRVRVVETWGKTDTVESARKIHRYAQRVNASEVRIDAGGVGGGVYDMLVGLDEFSDAVYEVIGWDNGHASPDTSKWANYRAYAHDSLRSQMMEGVIDLDLQEDEELKSEMQIITYDFTARGGIQITKKSDLKTEIGGSPDRTDAVIMAVCDMSPWTGNPWNDFKPGDKIPVDPADIVAEMGDYNPWESNPLYF